MGKCGKRLLQTASAGLLALGVALFAMPPSAVDRSANAPMNDGVDRSDPNFVKASILIMSRGEVMFSCAGHTAFRLECPTHKLDYCFSYESENIGDRIFAFFYGQLKMGLFAIPTKEFLSGYEDEGRGAMEYEMNLPAAVKTRLWKILDDKAAEGANLPYEYLKKGCCVQTAFNILEDAIAPLPLDSSAAKELPYASIREVFTAEVTPTHPWAMFMLHAICGTGVDQKLTKPKKLVVPDDLIVYLQHSKINGVPVLGEGKMILPVTKNIPKSFFSPLRLAFVVLLIAVLNFFCRFPCVDWLLLAAQSAAGAFFTYLVCFSSLPGTTWNWLIVPFNLLPTILWKWRRYWALPFALVLLVWIGLMVFSPQVLTDWAYVTLTFAYVVWYAGIWRRTKGAARGEASSVRRRDDRVMVI